jgi:hypothetical protein
MFLVFEAALGWLPLIADHPRVSGNTHPRRLASDDVTSKLLPRSRRAGVFRGLHAASGRDVKDLNCECPGVLFWFERSKMTQGGSCDSLAAE